MTGYQEIECPRCGDSTHIKKSGRHAHGVQRYRCWQSDCPTQTFMLDYRYKASEPGVKDLVVEMALNGSGLRDTARVLAINKGTVISTLKKSEQPPAGQSRLFGPDGRGRPNGETGSGFGS